MTADHAEPSIACTLLPAQLADRRAAWERLIERALCQRRPIPEGMQLIFGTREGVENELRELAQLEAGCCSFADWKVQRRGDEVALEVTARGEGVAAVRALFEGALSAGQPPSAGGGRRKEME